MNKIKILFLFILMLGIQDVYCQDLSASDLIHIIKLDEAGNSKAVKAFITEKGFEFMKNPDPNVVLYLCTRCNKGQTFIGFADENVGGTRKRYCNFMTSEKQFYIKLRSEFLANKFKLSNTQDNIELLKSNEFSVVIQSEKFLGGTSYNFVIGKL